MRGRLAIVVVAFAMQALAGCAESDTAPQKGIEADIDASRTQRGDSLYPDSTMPHHRPGIERYY